MKTLQNVLMVLLVYSFLAGCVVSVSPDMDTLVVEPDETVVFQIETIPAQAKYTWYVGEEAVAGVTGNSFEYTFTGENRDLTITVNSTNSIFSDQHRWHVICDAKEKQFTQEMAYLLENYSIPSVSGCLIEKGPDDIWDIVWKGAYGNRVVGNRVKKADLNTVYPIGSATKVFTATALVQLAEQGDINLDANVEDYLGFPLLNPGLDYEDPDDPIPFITVRHLLSHRSGLAREPMTFFFDHVNLLKMELGVFSDKNALKAYLEKDESWVIPDYGTQMYYKPGEIYKYSSIGYIILGYIIEAVTNNTWQNYIKENILDPLGMDNTKFYWSEYPLSMDNKAQGYTEKQFITNADTQVLVPNNPSVQNPSFGLLYSVGGPAGMMKSTVTDLAKFMIAHMNNGAGYKRDQNGDIMLDENSNPIEIRILSPEGIADMHNFDNPILGPVPNIYSKMGVTGLFKTVGYGLGWNRTRMGGRFWNYPWNPLVDPEKGVDWDKLGEKGIERYVLREENGLDVDWGFDLEGHGGDMPGYSCSMYKFTDSLAFIYLMNENYSEEDRDEHLIQPDKFMLYTTVYDGGPEINYETENNDPVTWALPHGILKFCELRYLLMKRAVDL